MLSTILDHILVKIISLIYRCERESVKQATIGKIRKLMVKTAQKSEGLRLN